MSMIDEHLKWLGLPALDRVTKAEGVVTSVCFDLFGCVQAGLTPETDDKGKQGESHWFDVKRLVATGNGEPVMPRPDFNAPEIGAAAKSPPP